MAAPGEEQPALDMMENNGNSIGANAKVSEARCWRKFILVVNDTIPITEELLP